MADPLPPLLQSTPIGSTAALDDVEREKYVLLALTTPSSIQKLIFSARTAAYIGGLVRSHNINESKIPTIAFIILRVCVAEIHLSKLATALSSELGVAADVAEKMSREIEHDLFAPVAGELNQYLATKKTDQAAAAATSARQAGATNVLNLNQPQLPKPPTPPKPLPPRPPAPPIRRPSLN